MTTEEIIRLYRDEKLSMIKIAKRAGVSWQAIQWRLKKAGIVIRTHKQAAEWQEKDVDEQTLRDLYLVKKLSYTQIRKRFGVSCSTVMQYLERYNIPIRSKKESNLSSRTKTKGLDEKTLRHLYLEKGLTQKEIAQMYGVAQQRISGLLKEYKLSKKGSVSG